MKLTLEFEFDEETQQYMVFCRPLGVATCGKNIPDAFEMIGDACAVYWRTLEDLGELEDKVFGVAERIDVAPEEIEQDIADAVKKVRGKINRAIGYNVCLDCGNRGWFELCKGRYKCSECGSLDTEDWTEQYTRREKCSKD